MTYADSGFVVSLYLTTEGTLALARKEVKRASKPILLSPLSSACISGYSKEEPCNKGETLMMARLIPCGWIWCPVDFFYPRLS